RCGFWCRLELRLRWFGKSAKSFNVRPPDEDQIRIERFQTSRDLDVIIAHKLCWMVDIGRDRELDFPPTRQPLAHTVRSHLDTHQAAGARRGIDLGFRLPNRPEMPGDKRDGVAQSPQIWAVERRPATLAHGRRPANGVDVSSSARRAISSAWC